MVLKGCLLLGIIDTHIKSIVRSNDVKFNLSMEDYTIILNALHYYKKVEKRGNFEQYDEVRINHLRDELAHQLLWNQSEHIDYS